MIEDTARYVASGVLAPNVALACACFECQVCKAPSIGSVVMEASNIYVAENHFGSDVHGRGIRWRPSPTETQAYPDVPEHIAEAATEAYECHSAQHHRGAILLARAVIEATAKEKGIVSGTLTGKIEELAKRGLIRPHIRTVADSVREFGNDMAHGDFVAPVTAEESTLVIELMGEILNEVYQSPAKLQAVQRAVAARKAKT